MEKKRLLELAGMQLNEADRGSVAMPKETMDRILEAMENAVHALSTYANITNAEKKDVANQLHSALALIDPHHTYKK